MTYPTTSPIHVQTVALRVDRNAEAAKENAKRKQGLSLIVKVVTLAIDR
jgi:hypothetical protein